MAKRYENVVFDDSGELMDMLEEKGPGATLDFIAENYWYPGEHEIIDELPHGTSDRTRKCGAWHLSWNFGLGYVGAVREVYE